MDLGVYITAKDDDIYIQDVIAPIIKAFPQAIAVDLGSSDKTVDKIRETGIPYLIDPCLDGRMFTDVMNKYASRHDWVFWVDSDEIYLPEPLEVMKELIERRFNDLLNVQTIRCGWKTIRAVDNGYEVSTEAKINGHKAYNTSMYELGRAWPREVLRGPDSLKEYPTPNGVWCYHAVLLNRSTGPEEAVRAKKRRIKTAEYNRYFEWERVEELPWKL
jgi:hypothetical protein